MRNHGIGRNKRGILRASTGLALALAVAACAPNQRGVMEPDLSDAQEPEKIEKPKPDAPNFETTDPVTVLELDEEILQPEPDRRSDPLPEHEVAPINARSLPISEVMKLALDGTGISLLVGDDVDDSTITVFDLGGSLGKVVDTLCRSAGAYCLYKDGVMEVTKRRSFMVNLPPVAEVAQSAADIVGNLTGGDTRLHQNRGILSYDASQAEQEEIKRYLDRLRRQDVVLNYEVVIWEVELNDNSSYGIRWNELARNIGSGAGEFALNFSGAAGASTASDAFSLEVDKVGGDTALNALFDALQNQGTVRTVSQPKISLLSGTSAKFTSEFTEEYVSEITRDEDDAGDTETSFSTDEATEGLKLNVKGGFYEGTVVTTLDMSVSDANLENTFQVLDETVILPTKREKKIATNIRSRPGDVVLLAGLNSQEDSENTKAPLNVGEYAMLPEKSEESVTREELVMAVVPRIVVFRHDGEKGPAMTDVDGPVDQPPGGMDAKNAEEVDSLLKRTNERGKAGGDVSETDEGPEPNPDKGKGDKKEGADEDSAKSGPTSLVPETPDRKAFDRAKADKTRRRSMVASVNVNVRSAPDRNSEKLGLLVAGAEVEVAETVENGRWARIRRDGADAYVFARYLMDPDTYWQKAKEASKAADEKSAED